MILDPQFLNFWMYSSTVKMGFVVSCVCFNLPLSSPSLCVSLTSFFPYPSSSLVVFSFLPSVFFTSGSLLTRISGSVPLNQGRGPFLCPPPCQPLPTLRQRRLVSLYSFLPYSIPPPDPSSPSSSFIFWRHGFIKATWPLHTLITKWLNFF